MSKAIPHVLFTLEGIGEEQGDHWKEYYLDGKMQRCPAAIIFPPFDKKAMS
jgi:hypothetical protein